MEKKKIQTAPTRRDIPRAKKNATLSGMPSVRPEELEAVPASQRITLPSAQSVQPANMTPTHTEVRAAGRRHYPTLTDVPVPPPSDREGYVAPTPSNGRYCHVNPGSDDVVRISSPRRRSTRAPAT